MKNFKRMLVVLLIMMIALPFNVKAETKKPEVGKEPVKIYLFRSNTCGYCEAAIKWFESIEEEYGDYFDLVDYEVSTQENSQLWEEVATAMGDTPSGVPYMVVGKYSYPNGFGADSLISSDSDKTMGDELLERVFEIYESDNRYDVMKKLTDKPDYNNIVSVVSIVVIAGLVTVAFITRRNSR